MRIVGWFHVPSPVVQRQSYEVAAWYCDSRIEPGHYPIVEKWSSHSHRWYWVVEFPATVVDKYTPSLFGGVPYGSSPQGENHPDVGTKSQISIWWDTMGRSGLAEALRLNGGKFPLHGVRNWGDKVYCPVTLLTDEAVEDRRWTVWQEPNLAIHEGKYHWSSAMRGYWRPTYAIRPRLFLPRQESAA